MAAARRVFMNKKTGGATPEPRPDRNIRREADRDPPESTPKTPKDEQQGPTTIRTVARHHV
jgi:hypothetical protein